MGEAGLVLRRGAAPGPGRRAAPPHLRRVHDAHARDADARLGRAVRRAEVGKDERGADAHKACGGGGGGERASGRGRGGGGCEGAAARRARKTRAGDAPKKAALDGHISTAACMTSAIVAG